MPQTISVRSITPSGVMLSDANHPLKPITP